MNPQYSLRTQQTFLGYFANSNYIGMIYQYDQTQTLHAPRATQTCQRNQTAAAHKSRECRRVTRHQGGVRTNEAFGYTNSRGGFVRPSNERAKKVPTERESERNAIKCRAVTSDNFRECPRIGEHQEGGRTNEAFGCTGSRKGFRRPSSNRVR